MGKTYCDSVDLVLVFKTEQINKFSGIGARILSRKVILNFAGTLLEFVDSSAQEIWILSRSVQVIKFSIYTLEI